MNIDPNEFAKEYLCGICKQLPKVVAAATDGHFYCRDCISEHIGQFQISDNIPSPATGEQIERTIVDPKTIQSLINNLVETFLY